jgi:hypothetical protein
VARLLLQFRAGGHEGLQGKSIMKHLGYFVMLLGVLIAAFGMVQLAWVCYTSPDPNPNPVGSGMLMTACLFAGITIFGIGGCLAGRLRWPLF